MASDVTWCVGLYIVSFPPLEYKFMSTGMFLSGLPPCPHSTPDSCCEDGKHMESFFGFLSGPYKGKQSKPRSNSWLT